MVHGEIRVEEGPGRHDDDDRQCHCQHVACDESHHTADVSCGHMTASDEIFVLSAKLAGGPELKKRRKDHPARGHTRNS